MRCRSRPLAAGIAIGDPIAYMKPWAATMNYRLRPKDFEMGEFVCNELMLSELPEMRPGQ